VLLFDTRAPATPVMQLTGAKSHTSGYCVRGDWDRAMLAVSGKGGLAVFDLRTAQPLWLKRYALCNGARAEGD
jgi:hypothetical protein